MTERQNNVRENSFWLLSARVTVQVLSVIFSAIVVRKLGVDEFGQYAFIASLVLIGNTFSSFGTDTFLIREIARTGTVGDIASRSLALQLFLTLLYLGAMLFIPRSGLMIFSFTLLPLTLISVNGAVFRAFGRMDLSAYIGVFSNILQVIAALLSRDLITLCYFLLIQHLIVMSLSYALSRGSLPTYNLFQPVDFRPIFRPVLPFATLTIFFVIFHRLGVISVSLLLGDSSTGFFSSAARVVDGLKFGHYSILGALLPAISSGTVRSWQNFRKAFFLLLSSSFVLAFFTTVFSRYIVLILFGAEFEDVSGYLSLMVWSLLPYTVSSFISYALIARGHETQVVKTALISVLISIVLYFGLIQTNGLVGAIWATVLGEVFGVIVSGWYYVRFSDQEKVDEEAAA